MAPEARPARAGEWCRRELGTASLRPALFNARGEVSDAVAAVALGELERQAAERLRRAGA